MSPPDLEEALQARLDAGGRCFVPYVTGGLRGVTPDVLRALQDMGADAIEVGIPFSDPVMDGPVIQLASAAALRDGATVASVLELIGSATLTVPVAVMTYLNPILAFGLDRFVDAASRHGVGGVIVPDLPVEEAEDWLNMTGRAGLAGVLLAAPGSSKERLAEIGTASRGFVYCVSSYGVTGDRKTLAGTARELVAGLRPITDRALLVGVGIATPEQAAAACAFADGVVVGTALVRKLLEGDAQGCLALAEAFRASIPRDGR
jgi:tryptophan synthase alpha chain